MKSTVVDESLSSYNQCTVPENTKLLQDGHNDYNRGMNRSRERAFTRNYSSGRERSLSNSRSRSGSRACTNRDRIRCYKCREYDHFARDCPYSREERNLEQLQQMLNMEEQTHRLESPEENYRSPLNL